MLIVNCEFCKKPFNVKPSRLKKGNGKYCSRYCALKASHKNNKFTYPPKVKCVCKICDKIFYVVPSRVKRGYGKYCSKSCSATFHSRFGKFTNRGNFMEKSNRWTGGRRITVNGYVKLYQPHHPNRSACGCVTEHRLVAEKQLNRFIETHETVHHINNDKTDNHPENLFVFESESQHAMFHTLLPNNPFLKTWLKSNII